MPKRTSSSRFPPGFGTIWVTVALDLVGFGIVLPILPLYADELGASPTEIGLLIASFSLAQFVFSPIWGRLSDRIGRKPVLIVSLIGTAVGSLITGLAGSLAVLFAGRVVDGISGASVSVAQAAVTDVAEPADRSRLLGLLGAAFGVGFIAGPALGALAGLGSARLPFFLAAGIAAVNAVVAMFRLPETRHRAVAPKIATDTSRREVTRRVARLLVVTFVGMVAFSGFEATFALLGERRFGLTISSVGVIFALVGIVLVGVQAGLVGPAVSRLGEYGVLRTGLVLNAAGLALLAGAVDWLLLGIALLLLVVGQGLLTPVLSSTLVGQAGATNRGAVLGVQQAVGGIARVIGPAAAGALFAHVGIPSPFLVGAALAALALALVPRAIPALQTV